MEPVKTRIRTNIIYGAIALLPVAALIYILVQLFGVLKTLSEPLISFLGTDSDLYLNMALLIFLRSSPGSRFVILSVLSSTHRSVPGHSKRRSHY
jgi:uncharacterized membrane protein